MNLLDYAKNIHSQNGEDGILSKIFEIIPVRNHWCVEFGAWDGRYLSNTCNLIENYGYSAVLIEPGKKKFADLLKNHGKNSKVIPLNMFVGFTANDNLDRILTDTAIPKDFDFLSIDIEGNDYHVWDATTSYVPKVVRIAFNPTIPTEVEFVQPAHPKVNQGASILSVTQLGRRKGYDLVCVTHRSAIFVQSKYFPLFDISNNEPQALRKDFASVAYLFSGYDGTLFVKGREMLPCHYGIHYQARIRQIPRFLRALPVNYRLSQRILFRLYRGLYRVLGRV